MTRDPYEDTASYAVSISPAQSLSVVVDGLVRDATSKAVAYEVFDDVNHAMRDDVHDSAYDGVVEIIRDSLEEF